MVILSKSGTQLYHPQYGQVSYSLSLGIFAVLGVCYKCRWKMKGVAPLSMKTCIGVSSISFAGKCLYCHTVLSDMEHN